MHEFTEAMTNAMMPDARGGAAPQGHAAALKWVFVYGTLRRGGSNDINRLDPEPEWVGTAHLRGRLFDLGPYPGLRLLSAGDPGGCDVVGEVYAITPALEAVLDRIEEISGAEDDEYQRRQISVMVQGHARTCLVYEIHPNRVRACPEIGHGDWMRHVMGHSAT